MCSRGNLWLTLDKEERNVLPASKHKLRFTEKT